MQVMELIIALKIYIPINELLKYRYMGIQYLKTKNGLL